MQILLVTEQTETVDEPDQSKIMIAVQMRNENMGNAAASYFIIDHLNLCAFAAINKKIISVHRHHLAGWMPVKCRYRGVIAEYSDCEHAQSLCVNILL